MMGVEIGVDVGMDGCPKCGTVDTGRFVDGTTVCIDCEAFDPTVDPFQYLKDDEARLGTSDYKGHAYFWAYEYRHYMRGFYSHYQSTESRVGVVLKQMRRSVHRDFLRLGLDLDGESWRHETVIQYHHTIADAKLKGEL